MWSQRAAPLLLAVVLLCCSAGRALGGQGGDCLAGQPVVVFGDAMSSNDAGQVYSAARKTNGAVWAEYANWTLRMDAALDGATASDQYASAAINDPRKSLSGQVQQYLASNPKDISTTCFMLFIGLEDLNSNAQQLLQNSAAAATVVMNMLGAITGAVGQLAAKGGRCFFVFSLPNPMLLPAVQNGPSYPSDIANQMGMYIVFLKTQLAALSLPAGTLVSVVDVTVAFNAALNGTAPNGSAWDSTTVPCVMNPQPNTMYNCGLRFWFDAYHPTTAAHQQLSKQFTQQICAALPTAAPPSPSPSPDANAARGGPATGLSLAFCLLALAVAWAQ